MEDHYGMGDLRHYIDGRPFFPPISQPPDLLSCHRGPHHPFDMLMFRSNSTAVAPSDGLIAFETDAGGLTAGADGGAGRWPRQETLTLLEIRSRLDPKFKEANQKGPLWDEVSRIMSEEHGYQRSGKKCREKFENLYKYYKKTKEGKAGRQDGKHYRFFRQLEAIYGESSNSASVHGGSTLPYNFPNSSNAGSKISDPDSCECDTTTTSSYCSESNVKKRRGKGRSFKAKIEESIDAQMKSMTEKQEAWMEKMTRVMEGKEREREMREEQWRKQDAARIESEHKMWANERAWIEARDAALMDAFNKLTQPPPPAAWAETEVARLIQLRSGMDLKFQPQENNGKTSEEAAWDEIAAKMGDRSGFMCRDKWDQIINDYLISCTNKRKDQNHSKTHYNPISSDQGLITAHAPPSAAADNIPPNDGFFRYFMGESHHQRL